MASRSFRPLMARMRSPTTRPAAAATVRGCTAATTTPSAVERGFIPLAYLVGMGGVEEAHALHDVMQAGDDREPGGQPHRTARDRRQREIGRASCRESVEV